MTLKYRGIFTGGLEKKTGFSIPEITHVYIYHLYSQ